MRGEELGVRGGSWVKGAGVLRMGCEKWYNIDML